MSDQGTGFTTKVIQAMCSLLGIEKIRTTLYHPQSNGSAKRVHITANDWKARPRAPPEMASAFGVCAHSLQCYLIFSYRVTPYYLMFGQRPRLPIDLLFPTRLEHNLTRTIDEYVETLYRHLWKSVKLAQDLALKEALRQKRLYDRKVGAVELQPGDHVLMKLDAF